MAEIRIRSYKPGDQNQCRSLWAELVGRHREIYDDPTIGGESPGLEFDDHLERVGAERLWVAEGKGEILGLTALIVDGPQGEVEPVIVKGDARGSGIGQALVSHAKKEAKKLGVLYLSAKPVARNREAIAFFRECGFNILGHVQLFIDLGEEPTCSWKEGPTLHGKSFLC